MFDTLVLSQHNISMSISLKDEHVFDDRKAKLIRVNQNGISQDDLLTLQELADDIIAGRMDVIALVTEPGVQFSDELSSIVLEQLNSAFEKYCTDKPFSYNGRRGNYAGLHVDGQLDVIRRQFLSFVDVRVHVSPGNFQPANCPEGLTERDFDPFFIFGRVRNLEVYPETLTQSYETFVPSLAVNLKNPVWNVFRANGRLDARASNVPVTHAVIPRVLAEDVLDPEAQVTPLANGDYQAVRLGDRTHRITPFEENPYTDSTGIEYGVSRTYDLLNFPIGPTRSLGRGLLA